MRRRINLRTHSLPLCIRECPLTCRVRAICGPPPPPLAAGGEKPQLLFWPAKAHQEEYLKIPNRSLCSASPVSTVLADFKTYNFPTFDLLHKAVLFLLLDYRHYYYLFHAASRRRQSSIMIFQQVERKRKTSSTPALLPSSDCLCLFHDGYFYFITSDYCRVIGSLASCAVNCTLVA